MRFIEYPSIGAATAPQGGYGEEIRGGKTAETESPASAFSH
jgi:hypothetical protein